MPKPLRVGDLAPDFSLPSSSGEMIRLYTVLERSKVVLFFFPRAFTPVCTAEVCGFRDAIDQFGSSKAIVFGISSDAPATLARFAEKHGVKYLLLSDETSEVRRSFGVPKIMGLLPGRVTYVIGQDRKIKHITSAAFASDIHVADSLKHVEETPIEQ